MASDLNLSSTSWYWIGANDRDSEETWVNSNGSAVNWTNWADGEPNNGD